MRKPRRHNGLTWSDIWIALAVDVCGFTIAIGVAMLGWVLWRALWLSLAS